MTDDMMKQLKSREQTVQYTQSATMAIQEYIETNYLVRWNDIKERLEIDGIPRTRNMVQLITHKMKIDHPSLPISIQSVENALSYIAIQNRYNPVHEYFDQLPTYNTGIDYVQKMVDCIPCEHDDVYELLITWLDNTFRKQYTATQGFMLVLAGMQGKNKGRFARYLASGITKDYPEMFTECSINPESKDMDMFQAEYFIWEVSEFASSFKKKDVDGVKQMITRDMVTGTKKLSGETRYQLSRAGLFGTINPQSTGFLVDETGSRRFPVIELASQQEVAISNLPKIDCVWSQIKYRYDIGIATPFMSKELIARVQERNRQYQVKDDMYEYLEDNVIPDANAFLSNDLIKSSLAIAGLVFEPRHVKRAMQSLGYEYTSKKVNGKTVRGYVGCTIRDTINLSAAEVRALYDS